MMPLTASDLADNAKQLRNVRPKLGGRSSALCVGHLKQFAFRNELIQLDTTASPALRL